MTTDSKASGVAGKKQMTCEVLPTRMPPIPPEKMTAEQKAAVAEMTSGGRGHLTDSYVPIMRSPALMRSLAWGTSNHRYPRCCRLLLLCRNDIKRSTHAASGRHHPTPRSYAAAAAPKNVNATGTYPRPFMRQQSVLKVR